jgi:hypothetical protein
MSEEREGEEKTPAIVTKRVADILIEEECYKMLKEVTDPYKLTEDERYKYERTLRSFRDLLVTIEGRWEFAFAEGFVEAFTDGREEDKAEATIYAAKYLKKRGFAHNVIGRSTGLSFEEIGRL